MNPEVQNYLEMYQTTQAYLKLSSQYCDYLGGIRWSSEDDTLVYPDGKVFAFHAPIAEFLEGFSGGGRVIPFGCVLHWAHLLQHGRMHPVAEVRRLYESFRETGSSWRNAGALAAVVSDTVPEVAAPPRLDHVCRRIRDRAFPIRWFTTRFQEAYGGAEVPALAPKDFERLIVERLEAYSEDDLRSWLADGRGPVREAGRVLAQEQPPPRTLTGMLAALLLRPRMAGAETHVTRLVGALTLPPRRLTPQELPVGGYTDMTTHGGVEHILPSQHALDDLEFLRRFAERELLFFRREEPPAQNRQELVVLIDQGVRTWGDVRLVLAAAALALGKQSADRRLHFMLAGTSNAGQLLDPMNADAEALGELMEASDLSLNPAAALESVLEQPSEALRDVVLLTHPHSLREADVRASALRALPRDRLFAVTLDEEGAAIVSEVRHGSPVKLRQFHVDYTPSIATPPPRPALPAEPLAPWTGDVEPVPFPFRFGTSGAVAKFEFDYDGRWLLTVGGDGMLHLWGLDGDHREVLPRPFVDGTLLSNARTVTGVKGGFVLLAGARERWCAVHYDVTHRRCRVRFLGPQPKKLGPWPQYVPELHTMLLPITPQMKDGYPGCALDLASGEMYSAEQAKIQPRARQAFEAFGRTPERQTGMARTDQVAIRVSIATGVERSYALEAKTGTILVSQTGCADQRFTPTADGKPLLKHATIANAQAVREVLALRGKLGDGSDRLLLFRGGDGAVLREHSMKKKARFLLAHDGRWLAIERVPRIVVERIDAPSEGMATRCGGYSGDARLYLGERSLLIVLGQGATHRHLVRWTGATVEFQYEHKKLGQEGIHTLGFQEVLLKTPKSQYCYDPQRVLVTGERDGLGFALDRYGQISVFSDMGNTLLCMFMAFRDRLAAWLPDGSRCGSEALGLGPETPGARATLAQVLQGTGGTLTFTNARNHGGLGC